MRPIIFTCPPLIFVLAPWLLLGLALSGAFVLLVTVFVAAAAIPVAVAAPFLLLRRLRVRRVAVDRVLARVPA